MTEKFDEFLEEVQKDIRQEKILQLWKRYGKQAITGISAILVLIVGYNVWGHYEQNQRIQIAEKMIAAQGYIAQGDVDKANTLLLNLSETRSVYRPLALFQQAGLLVQQGGDKTAEAIAIYTKLASNGKVDPFWRDLATLLSIMVSIDLPNVNVDGVLAQLEPLTGDDKPWRYFAKEMKGLLLYRKGEIVKSTEVFARLVQDNQTPSGISMRARLMVQIVSTGSSK